jgi:glutathione S-transferase
MEQIRVFGSDYSVYVRIVRLALHEKGISYDLVPIDIFAETGPPAGYLKRHPFARIPAFEHGAFRLYETSAITRYVDEGFPGPALQPDALRDRTLVNQIVSIADNYIYPTLVRGVYGERVSKPMRGGVPNETSIAAALGKATICLDAITELMGPGPWLAGSTPTLADFHVAPMFYYFRLVPEGLELMECYPNLSTWWSQIDARPSLRVTRPTPR